MSLAQIWRHPIKAHGFEALEHTEVIAGQTLPWDRTWAVLHEASKAGDDGAWQPCSNFSRGAKAPALMAIGVRTNTSTGQLTLQHPDHAGLTIDPDDAGDAKRFVGWVHPMMPDDRAASTGLMRAKQQGMTDTDFPSISLGSLSTLKALSERVGRPLDPRRFRINFWIDGPAAWEEFDWIDQTIQIGKVAFEARARITRCKSTMANPETGKRDADTLGALEAGWDHRDFGIALVATTNGAVQIGDSVVIK